MSQNLSQTLNSSTHRLFVSSLFSLSSLNCAAAFLEFGASDLNFRRRLLVSRTWLPTFRPSFISHSRTRHRVTAADRESTSLPDRQSCRRGPVVEELFSRRGVCLTSF